MLCKYLNILQVKTKQNNNKKNKLRISVQTCFLLYFFLLFLQAIAISEAIKHGLHGLFNSWHENKQTKNHNGNRRFCNKIHLFTINCTLLFTCRQTPVWINSKLKSSILDSEITRMQTLAVNIEKKRVCLMGFYWCVNTV